MTRARRADRAAVWVATAGFVGGAVFLFATAWAHWRLSKAREPSTCRVLSSRISVAFGSVDDTSVNKDKNPYLAHLLLEHDVGGVRFETEDLEGQYPSMASAGNATRRYTTGQELPCFYLADSPAVFTLGRVAPTWLDRVIAGLVALAIAGGAHIPFRRLRERLKRQS